MVMQLSPEDSTEKIIRTALAGDPSLLKVPKKGLMNAERKNTSQQLRRLAASQESGGGQEDLEDAKYFKNLADKNISGLLTVKEALEVADIFEEENPVIVDLGTEWWVETD